MSDVEILSAIEAPPTDERPWTVRVTYGVVDGRPAVVGVEIYAVDVDEIAPAVRGWPGLLYKPGHAEPITSTGIRLPLGEMLNDYLAESERRDRIAVSSPTLPEGYRREAERRLKALEQTGEEGRRGRPPVYPREHYERVADVYLRALRAGDPPTEAVEKARELRIKGKRPSRSQAMRWVAKARQLGLLPETVKGKAAGWSTAPPKGRRSK